jgi:hypothetical protein
MVETSSALEKSVSVSHSLPIPTPTSQSTSHNSRSFSISSRQQTTSNQTISSPIHQQTKKQPTPHPIVGLFRFDSLSFIIQITTEIASLLSLENFYYCSLTVFINFVHLTSTLSLYRFLCSNTSDRTSQFIKSFSPATNNDSMYRNLSFLPSNFILLLRCVQRVDADEFSHQRSNRRTL